jgi:hypothetical protein
MIKFTQMTKPKNHNGGDTRGEVLTGTDMQLIKIASHAQFRCQQMAGYTSELNLPCPEAHRRCLAK